LKVNTPKREKKRGEVDVEVHRAMSGGGTSKLPSMSKMSMAVERIKRIEPLKSCQIKFQYICLCPLRPPFTTKRRRKKKLFEVPPTQHFLGNLPPSTHSHLLFHPQSIPFSLSLPLDKKTLSTPPTIPTPNNKYKILSPSLFLYEISFRILNPRRKYCQKARFCSPLELKGKP
jgi:hypothetical protein